MLNPHFLASPRKACRINSIHMPCLIPFLFSHVISQVTPTCQQDQTSGIQVLSFPFSNVVGQVQHLVIRPVATKTRTNLPNNFFSALSLWQCRWTHLLHAAWATVLLKNGNTTSHPSRSRLRSSLPSGGVSSSSTMSAHGWRPERTHRPYHTSVTNSPLLVTTSNNFGGANRDRHRLFQECAALVLLSSTLNSGTRAQVTSYTALACTQPRLECLARYDTSSEPTSSQQFKPDRKQSGRHSSSALRLRKPDRKPTRHPGDHLGWIHVSNQYVPGLDGAQPSWQSNTRAWACQAPFSWIRRTIEQQAAARITVVWNHYHVLHSKTVCFHTCSESLTTSLRACTAHSPPYSVTHHSEIKPV